MNKNRIVKGAKEIFTITRDSDSSQLYAKGSMGGKRKWGYQKEIKK